MNIKITYNWLLEYLDTDADPYELQKYLSLCGPSVERVEKAGDDYVLDIEITSNRVDMASVFGIAQEALAILPQFGKKAKLKQNPLEEFKFKSHPEWNEGSDNKSDSSPDVRRDQNDNVLNVRINDPKLCPRFTALVLSNVKINKSPDLIRKRLQLCGVKSINNVIDISNYLMLSLGQPTHIFDYDKINDQIMIVRESKKGEKITTLDGKKIILPGKDIVIEDGKGALIDLCGIMGGINSSVTEKTKNVVLFVQTYEKKHIRKTSMLTGQRTMAATYFEKEMDEERVEPALVYGVDLLQKYAGATISSQLYDLYPNPYKQKSISLSRDDIERFIGVELDKDKIEKTLHNLGFGVKIIKNNFIVKVPSWRKDDVLIKEDVIEEIARIYGYHNLPVNLPSPAYVRRSPEIDSLFEIQHKIKVFFKQLGLHEAINYSMISEKMIQNMNLDPAHHLRLSNTISEELLYMRTSLLPSLVKNIKDNQGKRPTLRFFEIAKVYYPQKSELPKEIYKVAVAINTSFSDIKGIAEALLRELNISEYETKLAKIHIFSKNEVVDFVVKGKVVGSVGRLATELQYKNGLKKTVYLASFDLLSLVENAKTISKFRPINPYAVIKLDLTLSIKVYSDFVSKAKNLSPYLQKVELIDSFKDKKTVRLYFSSHERNLTEKEAQAEMEKIKKLAVRD